MTSLIKLINLILCISLLVLLISLLRGDHKLRQDMADSTLFSAQEILSKQALIFSGYALNNTADSPKDDNDNAIFDAMGQLLSQETPNLNRITVYDEHGNVRYNQPSTEYLAQQSASHSTDDTSIVNNAQQLVLVEEVYNNDKLIGFVTLTVDTHKNKQAVQAVMKQVEQLYVGFLICGIIISLLLVQLVRFLPNR